MIDEQDLYALGDDAGGRSVPCRPVGAVLARGRHLRRRRHALRSAGLGAVVMAVAGTAVVATGRTSGNGPDEDVAAGPDPTAPSTSDVPSAPPPPPPDCVGSGVSLENLAPPEQVPADQVADELRVLPGWTPEGAPISYAQGIRYPDPCPEAAAYPVDFTLVLQADGGDEILDADITVSGPLPWSGFDEAGAVMPGGVRETTIRGQQGRLRGDGGPAEGLTFAWAEPDGWSWEVRGNAVDEATLRALTEALVLDSSPEGDEPPVALAQDALPSGFELAWQQQGLAEPNDGFLGSTWTVQVGVPATQDDPIQRGVFCVLEVRPHDGSPITTYGGAGSMRVTVNGQPAMWAPWGGFPLGAAMTSLNWELAPGIRARADCVDSDADTSRLSMPLEVVMQFAESVEPVAADDPRLP